MTSSATTSWEIRPLQAHDIDGLLQLQTACYGDGFQEERHVFTQRLASPFQCSIGAVHLDTNTLGAYLAAYWSEAGKVTPLNGFFSAPTTAEPILYLHDLSVRPAYTGQGIARRLVHHLLEQARQRGVRQAALVSVQNTRNYWERQGFSSESLINPQQLNNLKTYGDGAIYMTMML